MDETETTAVKVVKLLAEALGRIAEGDYRHEEHARNIALKALRESRQELKKIDG